MIISAGAGNDLWVWALIMGMSTVVAVVAIRCTRI